MDNPNPETQKQQPENEAANIACKFLVETLQTIGMTEHMVLAIEPFSGPGRNAKIFASSSSSTEAMAHMLLFLLNRMDDHAVGHMLSWIIAQPAIGAKIAAHQAKQMAEQAEELKAKAAASPLETPQPQPAPQVPDKNKSWLN